jgi:hypothetical protein
MLISGVSRKFGKIKFNIEGNEGDMVRYAGAFPSLVTTTFFCIVSLPDGDLWKDPGIFHDKD